MPGTQGNENLYDVSDSAIINYSDSSEVVTLPVGTLAVTLTASTRCWVVIGSPGTTPAAAPITVEKVFVRRVFSINANDTFDLPVPPNTDANLVKVAVIRDSEDGVLDVKARKE
jgi:hypothetical protein